MASDKVTLLKHVRSSIEAIKSNFTSTMSKLATSFSDALEEVEGLKVDKPNTVSIVIPASGWIDDAAGSSMYPKYYDIIAESVTANDIATINVYEDSAETAKGCGLGSCTTLNGIIRIRAKTAPKEQMLAEYWTIRGKEET